MKSIKMAVGLLLGS